MRRHSNPYRINDPSDLLEVSENSSHPEMADAKRVWEFKGRVFHSATELQKFMENEGYNPRRFWMKPEWVKEDWRTFVRIRVVERVPQDERHLVGDLANGRF